MSVEANIAALTGAVTALTGAVDVRKSVLDAAVTAASGSAAQGAADRVLATAARDAAVQSAAQAAASAGAAGSGPATGLLFAAAARNLVTAADVVATCLYDTTRDDDGGAWTERCRHASWYQEPLNTATRGARRSFPALALIVVRAGGVAAQNSVTLYDAHDLDANGAPRMWMVFSGGVSFKGWTPYTGIFALNGRLYRTSDTGAAGDLWVADFVSDLHYYFGASGRATPNNSRLADRNAAGVSQRVTAPGIASDRCLGVHACVMPHAPLGPCGLPIPTIAVATAAGVSVIHPWGAVATINTAYLYSRVLLEPTGRLWVSSTAGILGYGLLPYGNASFAAWVQQRFDASTGAGPRHVAADARTGLVSSGPYLYAGDAGDGKGLSVLAPDYADPAAGMAAYIGQDYATGWLPGDCRGAWLCDGLAGALTAGQLVTNGDFAADVSGWSAGNGGVLSWVDGRMRVASGSASGSFASQLLATVPGQAYTIQADAYAGTGYWYLDALDGTAVLTSLNGSVSATGVMLTFVARSAQTRIRLFTGAVGAWSEYDNVTVRVSVADRSPRARGLLVRGALARTALPCGLAAISGFAAGNYLEQPYHSSLDVGTGDFCWSGWVLAGAAATLTLMARRDAAAAGPLVQVATTGTGRVSVQVGGGTVATGTSSVMDGAWHFVVTLRRAGVLEIWVDGVREATAANTVSATNVGALYRLGLGVDGVGPWSGSMALVCLAAYAPSPAQLRRMWEDGRSLILSGQPAMLGGTASACTALAANANTGTVAVGTGDGVSVLSGLARVAYHDGGTAPGAVGSDTITGLSSSGAHLLVATAAGAGVIAEAQIGRDLMRPAPMAAAPPVLAAVTVDATPVDISPRLYVGEGETRMMRSVVTARQTGASAGQVAAYDLRYLVRRDLGGALALVGSVTVTAVHETSAAMDVAVSVDATAQTVTERVTGLAGARLAWVAQRQVLPITTGDGYAA